MTDRILFVILGHFLPFYPTNNPNKQNLKHMKNTPGDIIILHKCKKIMIICYAVPEIWHMIDVIFIIHFELFFALLPPNSLKNQKNLKNEKAPDNIIILHKCFKNYNQMMYSSWDMMHDRRTDGRWKKWHIEVGAPLFKNCSSGPIKNKIFLIFTMLQFFEKIKKNTWRYHYFTSVYQKSWWYDLQFLRYRVWQTEIGIFRSFLGPFTP